MSMLSQDPADSAARERPLTGEALIREARRLQRRRRGRISLSVLLMTASAAAAAVIASSGGSGGGPARRAAPSRAASPAQISAFLGDAERGPSGTFSLTYAVTVRYEGGHVRHLDVAAAQRSPSLFYYRQTPSLSVSSPAGPPQSASYEVFFSSASTRRAGVGQHGRQGLTSAGAGLFTCTRGSASSRWSCTGPYHGIGMGTTGELLGPYPPQALLRGLQNTAEIYTGVPAPPATRPESAFLFTRQVAGQTLSCLGFGPASRPLGTVCLEPDGIIAFYDLPEAASSDAYATATLRAYSPLVRHGTFTLPVTPRSDE
jgi:hypothetical protein